MASRVAVIAHRARVARRTARVAEVVLPLVLRNARHRTPLVQLVGLAPATVLRREVRRAVAEIEEERRRQRRRLLRASIVVGAFAAAAVSGSSRRRGAVSGT